MFDRRGVKAHERNCEWEDYDGYHPSVDAEDVGDLRDQPDAILGSDPNDSGGDPSDGAGDGGTPERVDPDVTQSQETDTPDSGAPASRADGGPRSPPTPATTTSSSDAGDQDVVDDADQLPERFVDVDEYLEEIRREDPDGVHVDKLQVLLREYDVVDVVATDDERIAAYRFEEVPTRG